ncbi:GH92 family glycosyl hydrolase [Aureibacter tunicatorum]|uniref:Alpha-1,2-mannosidase n=1 Tax=Aureibacter tunicatorum TaxID=866807 RepID=A0AAE4BRA5_9BACT|nr:GH92 family glycosyl hydrolase [Aureibacter tunicatorum]MDR6237748.1 putative alpha-1,2-mannosidase [Aureibacter tunicatorum]BDD02783.1 alpha-1 2-mannosidase [Aureibacter tunicatorum]
MRKLNIRYFILVLIAFATACTSAKESQATNFENPNQYVDPFIGTGFHGHTFPGAVVPSGMVQLSPDTRIEGWDACSGYHYTDSTILGFSHTHLSGTGIGDMGDILVLPFTGEPKAKEDMFTYFEKENEHAEAGYYQVKMNDGVQAELTTTPRVGIHRYTYPSNAKRQVMFDITHTLQVSWGCVTKEAELEIINDTTIRGKHISTGWAADDHVYFYAKFSEPFTAHEIWTGEGKTDAKKADGKNIRLFLDFGNSDKKDLMVKVSISAVDMEGAQQNMMAELPGWEFDRVKADASSSWENLLGKIKIKSDDKDVKTNFYTALYHANIQPMIYHDVDGRYRGIDKNIHQTNDFTNYTVFSLWDTFRALHPLMTIIDEDRAKDYVNSLMQKYKEGGILPKWPLSANYTGTMVGYPAVSVIADAYTKGIITEGLDKALEASIISSEYHPDRVEGKIEPRADRVMPRHNYFMNTMGYIPADSCSESVSYGLENAYYDWCIAQMAKLSGNDDLYETYSKRGKAYEHYFDESTGFMRGKLYDGSWRTPFSPKLSDHEFGDFTEGNSWQWTWFVPHDVEGLASLMGGNDIFEAKLDTLFSTSSEIEGEHASADITGLIGQYAHGNEPSHHTAFLYNYINKEYKTQQIIDSVMYHYYAPTPEGICGNEDVGQMSAWYILNAIGFYQVAPGDPTYTIGRPVVDEAEVSIKEGTFKVIVNNNSKKNKYVQSVKINGKALEKLFFHHNEIKDGGLLEITMGPNPAK